MAMIFGSESEMENLDDQKTGKKLHDLLLYFTLI
jgi:hypothetical protein